MMNIILQICSVVIGTGILFLVALNAYFFGHSKGWEEGMDRMRDITFPKLQQLRDELDKERRKENRK
jgi:hypothetical protein